MGAEYDADNLTPAKLWKLISLSLKSGQRFPIPPELREWAIRRVSMILMDKNSTARNINSALRNLIAMDRINADLEINRQGSKLTVTPDIPPQVIQEAIETYARETAQSHGDRSGAFKTFARLVGLNGHGRKVRDTDARAGGGSNGDGSPVGGNGSGYPHN